MAIAAVMGWPQPASEGTGRTAQQKPPASTDLKIDFARIQERLGGDEKLLREVIEIFIEQAPQHVDTLRVALIKKDASAVEKAAHSIKGELGYLGVSGVLDKARELERLGREDGLAEAGEIFTCFENDIDQIIAALRRNSENSSVPFSETRS